MTSLEKRQAFINVTRSEAGRGLNDKVAAWAIRLDTEPRYREENGDPNVFMREHEETVRVHNDNLLIQTDNLFVAHPELGLVFDRVYIKSVLSVHEAEEVFKGDISWSVTHENGGLKNIGTLEEEKRQKKRAELAEIMAPLFSGDQELTEAAATIVEEFDSWEHSTDHNILLAKLFDIVAGNWTVIIWGNDLSDPKKAGNIPTYTGYRLKRVMQRLSETKEMQANPEVFAIVEGLALEQNKEWARRGINIEYAPLAPWLLASHSNGYEPLDTWTS